MIPSSQRPEWKVELMDRIKQLIQVSLAMFQENAAKKISDEANSLHEFVSQELERVVKAMILDKCDTQCFCKALKATCWSCARNSAREEQIRRAEEFGVEVE